MQRVTILAVLGLAGFVIACGQGGQDRRGVKKQYQQLRREQDKLARQSERKTSAHSNNQVAQRASRLEAGYRSFLEEQSEHAWAMVSFGSFLYDHGHHREALHWWETALTTPSGNKEAHAHAHNNIGNHHGHTGRAAEALLHYQKAYELMPREPTFRFNWATTCFLYRKEAALAYGWDTEKIFRQSVEQYRAARDLAPGDFSFASAYAETFYQLPNPDWTEAYAAWEFCLKQPLDDATRQRVYAHLARVGLQLRQYDKARSWLEKITLDDLQPLRKALERKLAQLTSGQSGS